MKNLMLPLLALLLFAACQNSSTPAADAQKQDVQAEFKIDPVQLKEASTKAKTVIQNMNNLLSEINEAAPSLSEAQKVDLEAIRSQLDDVMGKQETMTKALEHADNSGGQESSSMTDANAPTPGVIQDYIESTSNYDKFIEDLRAQLQALKSGKGKGQ